MIRNFPKVEEFDHGGYERDTSDFKACYVGYLSRARGTFEILDLASMQTDVHIEVAGVFKEPEVKELAESHAGWDAINYHGWANRESVAKLMSISSVGLVPLHPIINYQDALPVKLFEYMASGMAVIATDIPLWRAIIEGANCGLLVDPRDSQAFASKLLYLKENPDMCRQMGENGKAAIEREYNWRSEEERLFVFYALVIDSAS